MFHRIRARQLQPRIGIVPPVAPPVRSHSGGAKLSFQKPFWLASLHQESSSIIFFTLFRRCLRPFFPNHFSTPFKHNFKPRFHPGRLRNGGIMYLLSHQARAGGGAGGGAGVFRSRRPAIWCCINFQLDSRLQAPKPAGPSRVQMEESRGMADAPG